MKTLFFKVHPMIKAKEVFYHLVIPKQITILSEMDNLTEVIRDSGTLITDYSSVVWDYIYNNRNVIAYPFDYEEYSVSPGLYMNLNNEKVFNSVDSADSVVAMLSNVDESVGVNCERFFDYNDKNNCERIYKEILYRLN